MLRYLIAVIVLTIATLSPRATSAESLPFLHAAGSHLADPSGSPVILKGCNIGNWFLLEPWMFGGCLQATDQAQIFSSLANRFGVDRRDHLVDLYRSSYITPRDFAVIKSFGFNVVRIPFHYSLIQDDQPPYAIKPHVFDQLDRALSMAEGAGIYVILDLHGAPGGQSKDMPTGQVAQNHLWTDPVAQERTNAVWRAVADRYHDRAVVAGYDLLNEPYGDFKQNLRPDLLKLMSSLYATVRAVDDRHVIFFSGPIQKGITFYGSPAEHGWHDVGFTEHYYPGLFGSKPVIESHATLLTQTFPERKRYLDRIGAPYYVGEFNVVLSAAGGNRMMREYFDRIGENGWTCTMWSYKLLRATGHGDDRDVWYVVTNRDPLPKLDLQQSSYDDFEKFCASLAEVPLAVNEPLRAALLAANPSPLPLAKYSTAPTTVPAGMNVDPPGWTATDIGGAAPGGTLLDDQGVLTIYGGGSEIFATSDSFRFLSQPAAQPMDRSTRVLCMLDTDLYAKAGLMARWSMEPNSPFAMVNVFPDGSVAMCSRSSKGATTTEKHVQSGVPIGEVVLRLTVEGGHATAYFRRGDEKWRTIAAAAVPADAAFDQGYAVCAHRESGFTVARFAPPEVSVATTRPTETSLSDDWQMSGAWRRSGDGGSAVFNADASGRLWQEIPVQPGRRYRFTVDASGGDTTPTTNPTRLVELRLEGTLDDQPVALNAASMMASHTMSIIGTAIGSHLRVVIVSPAQGKIAVHRASLADLSSANDACTDQ